MTESRILNEGEMESAFGEIQELFLPGENIFQVRAERFHQLAQMHGLSGYLQFLAKLAELQAVELKEYPEIPFADSSYLKECLSRREPPLAPGRWLRHPYWLQSVRRISDRSAAVLPDEGRKAMQKLLEADDNWLNLQADLLLGRKHDRVDAAHIPVIGAALQVQWAKLAMRLDVSMIARPPHPVECPVCGSDPVAAIINNDHRRKGLRYLQCGLCGSEWHVVRSKCSYCDSAEKLEYFSLDSTCAGVSAETCSECHTYLKIFNQEKNQGVEPIADDVASFSLDLAMGEKGYFKRGNNYFMGIT